MNEGTCVASAHTHTNGHDDVSDIAKDDDIHTPVHTGTHTVTHTSTHTATPTDTHTHTDTHKKTLSYADELRQIYTHRRWRKWVPVGAGMLYCLAIGIMHCFGNMTVYITSYMRYVGRENVSYKDLQWVYATSGVFQGVFGFFGGRLEQTYGPRKSALLAGSITSLGVFLSYYTVSSFYGLMITYGVLLGIGSGLSYPIPLTLALKWHPHKKGLVSGLIFVARGLSVFVFTPLQTYYVNPYNISPVKMSVYADIQDVPTGTPKMEKYFVDERVLNRVPMLFVCMGSLCMIIQCVSASLMPNPSHVNHEEESLLQDSDKENEQDMRETDNVPKLPLSYLIRTRQFWIIWAIMFLNWQAVSFMNGFWKVIGQVEFHMTDSSLAAIGASVAVTNSMGRVVWGTAGDKYGFTHTMLVFCVVYTFFLATTPFCGLWHGVATVTLYTIWLNVLKIADGGAFTIIPPITSNIFGLVNFGPVFGLLFTARAISSLVGANMASCLYHILGNTGMCLLVALCTLLSGMLVSWCQLKPILHQLQKDGQV